jgi:hypothetical protein
MLPRVNKAGGGSLIAPATPTAFASRPMKTLNLRAHRALAAALAVAAVSLLAAAPRASAGPPEATCGSDGKTFEACVQLNYKGYLWYDGWAGLDVYLPAQYAAEIVACGADPKASLWGDDDGWEGDDFIRNLVVTPGWPQAKPSGFGVTFNTSSLYYTQLDEDDGTDEIYIRFSYWDCHTGLTRTFRSPNIVGNFNW